jgi:hypothetical protein
MRFATLSLCAGVLAACCATGAWAQSTQAVKSAHDATLKAQAITYTLRDPGGATYGTAQLTTIGRTRTRILINFQGALAPGAVRLVRASDCPPNALHAATSAGTTLSRSGPISDTVVALPLGSLNTGNYAVRFRQANLREVCTQLH